jgi:hypothetical protein
LDRRPFLSVIQLHHREVIAMTTDFMNAQSVARNYSEDELMAEASARCGIVVGPDGCLFHSAHQTEEEAHAIFNKTYVEVLESVNKNNAGSKRGWSPVAHRVHSGSANRGVKSLF